MYVNYCLKLSCNVYYCYGCYRSVVLISSVLMSMRLERMVVEGNDGNMVYGCFEISDIVVFGSFFVCGICF